MSPILKFLLNTLIDPPKFLRKKLITEDGYQVEFGELVFGANKEGGDVLPFYVGNLPKEDFKYFKNYNNAKNSIL